MEDITEYEIRVWTEFIIKNLPEYHDLYVQIDVVSVAPRCIFVPLSHGEGPPVSIKYTVYVTVCQKTLAG